MNYEWFEVFEVELLKDHHPVGYRDEWVDAGTIVYACIMPHNSIYLSEHGKAGKMGQQDAVFNSNAKLNEDFVIV